VFRLDRHVTPLIEANTFRAVPGIGPTTDRIARELIHDGQSTFVEDAIPAACQREAIATLRAFRQHFKRCRPMVRAKSRQSWSCRK
jgi:hypothetical protein